MVFIKSINMSSETSTSKCCRRRRDALKATTTFSHSNLLYIEFLLLFICLAQIFTNVASIPEISIESNNVLQRQQQQSPQQFKLDCQPGEQRHFNYESSTNVWGSASQQVHLRASLRLRCMEAPTNTTLKYLAEVLTLTPSFGDQVSHNTKASKFDKAAKDRWAPQSQDGASKHANSRVGKLERPQQQSQVVRAEPVFEEVGEAAIRMKRSVTGWFSKTWSSVKDFFVNIFNSSEKSSVSRDQALSDSGIDIANQCRAAKGKTPGKNGLPIDDSVFDDLEPKYYIGASSIDSLAGGGTTYNFIDTDDDGDEDDSEAVSFFDDPKPVVRSRRRVKRATTQSGNAQQSVRSSSQMGEYDEKLLKLPFVFVQSRTGKILEVRFSGEETDLSVKNFKRHLCDIFATNLDKNKSQLNEVTPIGKHTTNYLVDSSVNSTAIKQSLMKLTNKNEAEQSKQLVRALAMVGMQSASALAINELPPSTMMEAANSVESRDPTTTTGSSLGDNLSVLRSINSTSNIQLNSRTITPDIDQIQVRVQQVQHISDGRMTGTAGQLGMSLIQTMRSSSSPHLSGGSGKLRVGRSTSSGGASSSSSSNKEQVADIAGLIQVSTSFSVQLVPVSKLGNFVDMTAAEGAGSDLPLVRVERSLPRFKSADTGNDDDDSLPSAGAAVAKENSKNTDNGSSITNRNATTTFNVQELVALESNLRATDSSIKQVGQQQVSQQQAAARQRTATDNSNADSKNSTATKTVKREPLVTRPADLQELQKTMQEWRQLEMRLQFTSSSLLPESNGQQDGQLQRLEILRDQIQMRLNEEFMRNKLRRDRSAGVAQEGRQMAATATTGGQMVAGETTDGSNRPSGGGQVVKRNELGLGLTQLIIDSGVTSKRKGSVYTTIEEVLELEMSLGEDSQGGSVSRLLRDTVRIDKLRAHCRSAIASLDEIRAQSARLEMKSPFDTTGSGDSSSPTTNSLRNEKLSQVIVSLTNKNRKRLEQCKQVVQLLLRVSERQVADLAIELMDECNNRMLAGAKEEELGYGPLSRYYRNLRQQFTELMSNLNRPSETMLDQLVSQLYYTKLPDGSTQGRRSSSRPHQIEQEFTYVSTSKSVQIPTNSGQKYNKSLLREDDYNNNDGSGSLVMTITSLAAKASIRHSKRVEIVDKLLFTLKGSTCSLFNGPDLDILESMGNFHEPLDEIVGKVVHLARRCKHQDQYVVACIHGLQGQVRHNTVQRFLIEQLRSTNVSCTVKSEIVLTLTGAILIDDLKQMQPATNNHLFASNNIPPPSVGDNNSLSSPPGTPAVGAASWPSVGLNQLDDTLLELVNDDAAKNNKLGRAQDRKCLSQLVAYYMSKKRRTDSNDISSNGSKKKGNGDSSQSRSRNRRAVINENSFWDDAQCKRWALPDVSAGSETGSGSSNPLNATLNMATDLIDEIDDNSILVALANNRHIGTNSRSLSGRRNQKLVEREADLPPLLNGTVAGGGIGGATAQSIVRKRHKCSASKTYGPKNAEAILKAEIVNDLIGAKDENKFLARFRLATNFLGNRIDVGRMYLWHQKRTTRAHVNILGKSLWDTSHSCQDKAPHHLLYMPLFDFNLWLVKVSVGLRLHSEMGFFSNCNSREKRSSESSGGLWSDTTATSGGNNDELELYPTITVKASGEASAKFVVARAGMSLASQYGYQGSIRVSKQPESCMSIYSAHQPMNITFSSWFQLWDNDCHYWGSRNKAEPQATKWKLGARKPTAWLEDECLAGELAAGTGNGRASTNSSSSSSLLTRSPQSITISP